MQQCCVNIMNDFRHTMSSLSRYEFDSSSSTASELIYYIGALKSYQIFIQALVYYFTTPSISLDVSVVVERGQMVIMMVSGGYKGVQGIKGCLEFVVIQFRSSNVKTGQEDQVMKYQVRLGQIRTGLLNTFTAIGQLLIRTRVWPCSA